MKVFKMFTLVVSSLVACVVDAQSSYTATEQYVNNKFAKATNIADIAIGKVLEKIDYSVANTALVESICLVVTNAYEGRWTDWTVTSDPPMPAEWTYYLTFDEESEEYPVTGWVVEIYDGGNHVNHVGEGLRSGNAESTSITWSTEDRPGTPPFLVIDDDYTNIWNSGTLTITRQYIDSALPILGLATVSNLNASADELRREMAGITPGNYATVSNRAMTALQPTNSLSETIIYSDWVISGLPDEALLIVPVEYIQHQARYECRVLYKNNYYVLKYDSDDQNATYLAGNWYFTTPSAPGFWDRLVASRKMDTYYILGSQIDKPLQPAGNYVTESEYALAIVSNWFGNITASQISDEDIMDYATLSVGDSIEETQYVKFNNSYYLVGKTFSKTANGWEEDKANGNMYLVGAYGTNSVTHGGMTSTAGYFYKNGSTILQSADGINCHAEGYYSQARGEHTHAEGVNTKTYGWASHAEGSSTMADGNVCHAGGEDSKAFGWRTYAQGWGCEAYGQDAIIMGVRASNGDLDYYDSNAFVWQGTEEDISRPEDLPQYFSHGPGTFNINPAGGLDGFWIGEKPMSEHISDLFGGYVSTDDGIATNLTIVGESGQTLSMTNGQMKFSGAQGTVEFVSASNRTGITISNTDFNKTAGIYLDNTGNLIFLQDETASSVPLGISMPQGKRGMKNSVMQTKPLGGRVFDFSTMSGFYEAISNVVEVMGGTIINYPTPPKIRETSRRQSTKP